MTDESPVADFGSALLPVLEQSAFAVVLIDEQGKVIFFSGGADRLWDYKRHDALGQTMQLLLPDPVCLYISSKPAGDKSRVDWISQDLLIRRRDGTQQWARVSVSRANVTGRIYHMALARDASEEMAIRKQNILLLAAANHTDQAILVLDQTRRIVHANQAFTDTYGYEADDVLGQEPTPTLASPLMSPQDIATFHELPWGKERVLTEAQIRA